MICGYFEVNLSLSLSVGVHLSLYAPQKDVNQISISISEG